MPEAEAVNVITAVQSLERLGVIGIMALIIYFFLKGDIFTKKMLDKTLEVFTTQFGKSMEEAITRALNAARVQWQEEVLDYAKETSHTLETLPCVQDSKRATRSQTRAPKEAEE